MFWNSCFFQHVNEGEQGSSWIELFAYFKRVVVCFIRMISRISPAALSKHNSVILLVHPGPFLLPKALLQHQSFSNPTARQGADWRDMGSAFASLVSVFFYACLLKLPRLCTGSYSHLEHLEKRKRNSATGSAEHKSSLPTALGHTFALIVSFLSSCRGALKEGLRCPPLALKGSVITSRHLNHSLSAAPAASASKLNMLPKSPLLKE